jgi:hypothetical protein
MQPEPVLHFSGQAAEETSAQGIGGHQQHQDESHNTKLAERIIVRAGVELRCQGGSMNKNNSAQNSQGAEQKKPVEL